MSAKILQFPTPIAASVGAALDPLRARFLSESEQRAQRDRLDMGEWPRRLASSCIELDDDAKAAILLDRCRDEKPLERVRAWYAKRHPSGAGERPSGPPWLFLCGPRGIGKSTAAGWVLARQWGVACTMTMLLADFATWKRCKPDERHGSAFERYKRATVLVLEELGTEPDREADKAREAVFALVNGRQSRRTDTLVLTNLSKAMIVERVRNGVYDERTHDRLRSMSAVLGFEGESLRRSVVGGGL